MPLDFDQLRRRPDLEAPNLVAVDAADRLILDEAAAPLAAAQSGEVVVIGDHYGALTLGAADRFGLTGIRVHQDALTGEQALALNAADAGLADVYSSLPLDASLVAGAKVVLLQLPRSLDALDEIAAVIAEHAHPEVVVYAGGRLKHMTLAMNDVLASHFDVVYAGLSRQKSRVLTASEPREAPDARPFPRSEHHSDLDLTVVAHGGAFAGTKVDIGTRMLLGLVAEAVPDAVDIVDLGCGTGVIAAFMARTRPEARIIASDRSAAAMASAIATMEANGVANRVTVVRDNALESMPDASADLVLLNPPFHADAAVAPEVAVSLFEAAARVLRPGGELWCVFNSHLHHRAVLERVVGSTRQVARSPKFIVTASTKG